MSRQLPAPRLQAVKKSGPRIINALHIENNQEFVARRDDSRGRMTSARCSSAAAQV
jgi:hypothetical protein